MFPLVESEIKIQGDKSSIERLINILKQEENHAKVSYSTYHSKRENTVSIETYLKEDTTSILNVIKTKHELKELQQSKQQFLTITTECLDVQTAYEVLECIVAKHKANITNLTANKEYCSAVIKLDTNLTEDSVLKTVQNYIELTHSKLDLEDLISLETNTKNMSKFLLQV